MPHLLHMCVIFCTIEQRYWKVRNHQQEKMSVKTNQLWQIGRQWNQRSTPQLQGCQLCNWIINQALVGNLSYQMQKLKPLGKICFWPQSLSSYFIKFFVPYFLINILFRKEHRILKVIKINLQKFKLSRDWNWDHKQTEIIYLIINCKWECDESNI